MNRRRFLAAAVSSVGVAAATAGCTGRALGGDDSASNDDGADRADGGEITVTADGEAEAEPDRAVVTVGLEASGESAEAVTDELAAGADRLRETFDDLESPDERVEEGRYRVRPARGRETDGFEGSHSFAVTLTDVDRVGEVIDAAVAAGADEVGRVTFGLREETRSALRADAIDAALDAADDEAAHVADNRSVELEGAIEVTTDDVRVRPVREGYESDGAADAAAPPTEIEADPVSVTASVTVTYAFGG